MHLGIFFFSGIASSNFINFQLEYEYVVPYMQIRQYKNGLLFWHKNNNKKKSFNSGYQGIIFVIRKYSVSDLG